MYAVPSSSKQSPSKAEECAMLLLKLIILPAFISTLLMNPLIPWVMRGTTANGGRRRSIFLLVGLVLAIIVPLLNLYLWGYMNEKYWN